MTSTPADPAARTKLECVIPILSVRELPRSLDYYIRVLGFSVEWAAGEMASVSRDGLSIYLYERAQGHPGTWIWIGVEDVEALHHEYQSSGAVILQEPTNYPWALEMRVEDPDGHVLRIGSEPKVGEPSNA